MKHEKTKAGKEDSEKMNSSTERDKLGDDDQWVGQGKTTGKRQGRGIKTAAINRKYMPNMSLQLARQCHSS